MSTVVPQFKVEVLHVDQLGLAARFLESEHAANLDAAQWLRKFDLMWDQNPFFDSVRHARAWLLLNDQDAICGFLGNIPVKYLSEGVERQAFWATTWYVAEPARRRSLDLFRMFVAQEGILFDTTPTPGVELILVKRFKFAKLETDWQKNLFQHPVHVRSLAAFIRWRLGERPFIGLLALPACALIKLVTWCRARFGRSQPAANLVVAHIDVLPDDTDEWWETYSERSAVTLVRNRQALQWLFFSDSYSGSRKVLQIRQSGRLLGFVGLKLIRMQKFSVVELVDLVLLDLTEQVLCAVIAEINRTAARWSSNVAFVSLNAFSAEMAILLLGAGFWKRRGSSRYYFLDKSKKLLAGPLWATPVDGDRGLFP